MTSLLHIGCLGLNYRSAPVAIRERFSPAVIKRVLDNMRQTPVFEGVAILSTCNRIEFYVHSSENTDVPHAILDFLTQTSGIDLQAIRPHFYQHASLDAVVHLCRVAAGLDSMVLGESQILGQVGDSFRQAESLGMTSSNLTLLFQTALRVGKRARAETALNHNPISVGSVAVNLARRTLGPLADLRVSVIGAGEMGRRIVKILKSHNIERITILNRNETRGEALAEQMGCQARPLREMSEELAATDLVITVTKAETPLIHPHHVAGHSLVLIDLAVPRNIDTTVGSLDGIHLFDIDNLRDGIEASLSERRREVPKVEQLIEEEIAHLTLRLRESAIEPAIAELRQKAESIRQQELERTLNAIETLSPEIVEQLQFFSRALVNKLLHDPTLHLRKEAAANDAERYTALIRTLFAL